MGQATGAVRSSKQKSGAPTKATRPRTAYVTIPYLSTTHLTYLHVHLLTSRFLSHYKTLRSLKILQIQNHALTR
jgi:hypothetical protein